MLNTERLEFLRYLLFQKIWMKAFNIFNSAWPQCEAFLANFRLLRVQNVVESALMKINHFCFCCRKLRCKVYFRHIGRIITMQQCKTKNRQKIDVAASKGWTKKNEFKQCMKSLYTVLHYIKCCSACILFIIIPSPWKQEYTRTLFIICTNDNELFGSR